MTTANVIIKEKNVELNDLVFLFFEGKHIVDSFTKTAIRFKNIKTGKIQTFNKNTFLKKHVFTKDNIWKYQQKIRTINMDYI